MLEPFITPTVASYNFNISSCNCSESVLLLNRALHWMQQINNNQRNPMAVPSSTSDPYLNCIHTASQNKFSRVVSPFGKFRKTCT